MPIGVPTAVVEVAYLSMNNTHIQVEHVGLLGIVDEYWIALSEIHSPFSVLDDIMDLEVSTAELDRIGLHHA